MPDSLKMVFVDAWTPMAVETAQVYLVKSPNAYMVCGYSPAYGPHAR